MLRGILGDVYVGRRLRAPSRRFSGPLDPAGACVCRPVSGSCRVPCPLEMDDRHETVRSAGRRSGSALRSRASRRGGELAERAGWPREEMCYRFASACLLGLNRMSLRLCWTSARCPAGRTAGPLCCGRCAEIRAFVAPDNSRPFIQSSSAQFSGIIAANSGLAEIGAMRRTHCQPLHRRKS